ncbi:MAG: cyclopropane-fatty-acyl-phospholipid synthase family protein [Patescibacteria group bacterium]
MLRQWLITKLFDAISNQLDIRIDIRHAGGGEQTVGPADSEGGVGIRFESPAAYRRMLFNPFAGFCEAYINGEILILSEAGLPRFLRAILGVNFGRVLPGLRPALSLCRRLKLFSQTRLDHNSPSGCRQNAKAHYDVHHKIVKRILDPTLQYSCARFDNGVQRLGEAQRRKTETTLLKLLIRPGDRLLDIGCGYGDLISEAASMGAEAVGITLSAEQAAYATERMQSKHSVGWWRVWECDYRGVEKMLELSATDRFNKLVSIGMFEHVGPRHWKEFFQTAFRLLETDGVFLLQTIFRDKPAPTDSWIRERIFPGGFIPDVAGVLRAAMEAGFELRHFENWQNWYERTCAEWLANLRMLRRFVEEDFGLRHFKTLELYLAASAAAFSRHLQVGQFVFTRGKPSWSLARMNEAIHAVSAAARA